MPGKQDFIFLSNYLCLDFANTKVLENGYVRDLIPDFKTFLDWLVAAHIIQSDEAAFYVDSFSQNAKADEMLQRVYQLRDAIRLLAENLSEGLRVDGEWNVIETVNTIYRKCRGFLQIEATDGGLKETFVCDTKGMAQLLLPIAKSVSELLRGGNSAYIRSCSNPNCILFFYDTSKNHSRRWCNMDTCGNRVKVSAHYRRHRKG
jgi:predicted RNA-binding Zn ribbon-like protein